jgi:hypothetical protein
MRDRSVEAQDLVRPRSQEKRVFDGGGVRVYLANVKFRRSPVDREVEAVVVVSRRRLNWGAEMAIGRRCVRLQVLDSNE